MHGAASTALGAGLHTGGSLLIVCGQTTLKVAQLICESSTCKHTWKVEATPGQQRPQWRSPDGRWRAQWLGSKGATAVGWSGFVVGNLMRFAAMRFGAQAVLSALTSAQFIVIPVASYVLLGEQVTASTIGCIAIVLLGNALIIGNGPAETAFSLEQLRTQWLTLRMRIFLGVMALLLAGLHGGLLCVRRLERERSASQRARWRARMKPNSRLTFAHALLFSAFSALVGANSVLFSKSLTYVITAPWPAQLADWYSWAVLAAFIATGGYWVHRTAVALRKFPATLVMSVMQAFWMCQSIIAGGVYFNEFAELSGWRAAGFSAGLVAAIAGALGMGCASFVAEQHAMISYTILPGYGNDAESLLDQSKMRAYGLRFAGLGTGGGTGGELQLQELHTPGRGGGEDSESDVEEGGSPASEAGAAGGGSSRTGSWELSRGSSAADLPKAGSLDWRQNMEVLADRLSKPADDWMASPKAVHITASSAQLVDLPPPSPEASGQVYRQQQQPPQLQRSDSSFAAATASGGGGGTASASSAAAGGETGRMPMPPADSQTIMQQHAAAINASLAAAGSRLAAGQGSKGGVAGSAAGRSGQGPLSEGGSTPTGSMLSATSGRGDGFGRSSAASTPRVAWQQQQQRQAAGAGNGGSSPVRAGSGADFAEESLLDSGDESSSGGLFGQRPQVLARGWRALRQYIGR